MAQKEISTKKPDLDNINKATIQQLISIQLYEEVSYVEKLLKVDNVHICM